MLFFKNFAISVDLINLLLLLEANHPSSRTKMEPHYFPKFFQQTNLSTSINAEK